MPEKIPPRRPALLFLQEISIDQGIGRIIQSLRETGELDNTLILFLSDNGASPENCMQYGPGFDRPSETREGEKIVYPVNKEVMPGPQTTFTSIGERWANVANTPFRYWKMESYEGGVHTPMIAFWPKGITASKGSMTDQVGHVMDFMATFVELADAQYPAEYNQHPITPLQGLSLAPIFRGEDRQGHDDLFNEHMGGRFVRHGEWKQVALEAGSPWELYHIKDDRTELNNVAAQNPDILQQLDSLWQEWALQNHVLPKPGSR